MEYSLKRSESESHSVMSDSLRPHGRYSPWNSPGQTTGVGSLSLLQGIFPTQGSNPGLLHCRKILYQLNHKGSPRILEWVAYPFSSRSSWSRNLTRVSCIAGGFFTSWAMKEAQRRWKWSIFSLLQWVILQYVACCNCILNTKWGIGNTVCYWYYSIWMLLVVWHSSMEIWYASKITENTLCLLCTWWYLHGVDIQLFSDQKPETKGK